MKHLPLVKKIGLSLLSVPVAFLLFFGIGEMVEGVPGGIIHFVQLLPLVILLIIAWFSSEWAGYLLIIIGSILGFLYVINAHFPLQTIVLVEIMLFVMPVIAGLLLVYSKRSQSSRE